MDKKVYAHIGIHKSASTFLQRRVFPYFNNVKFFKKSKWRFKHKLINASAHNLFLVTNECRSSKEKFIKTLFEEFPGAVPIIFLRSHDKWVASKYKYYLKKSGTLSFSEYSPCNDNGVGLSFDDTCFYNYIERIKEYFPDGPVVFFTDELNNNPHAVIQELADLMNTDIDIEKLDLSSRVNAAFGTKQLLYVRAYNRWYERIKKNDKFRKIKKHSTYGLAYISRFFPESFAARQKPLIPAAGLAQIRERFADDWDRCCCYAGTKRKNLYLS